MSLYNRALLSLCVLAVVPCFFLSLPVNTTRRLTTEEMRASRGAIPFQPYPCMTVRVRRDGKGQDLTCPSKRGSTCRATNPGQGMQYNPNLCAQADDCPPCNETRYVLVCWAACTGEDTLYRDNCLLAPPSPCGKFIPSQPRCYGLFNFAMNQYECSCRTIAMETAWCDESSPPYATLWDNDPSDPTKFPCYMATSGCNRTNEVRPIPNQ